MLSGLAACGDGGLTWDGTLGTPVVAEFPFKTPTVTATVDGDLTGRFLVDTGAPFTILDTDSFTGYEIANHDIDLEAFGATFLGYQVTAYDALPFDMGEDRIDGIIGGSLLGEFVLALDYRGGRAWLYDDWDGSVPDDAEYEAVYVIDFDLRGGGNYLVPGGTIETPATRILVDGVIEGQPFTALLDTGASAVVLSETLVDRLGDGGRPRLDGVTVGTSAGALPAYFTRVGIVELGDSASRTSVAALVVPGWNLFDLISSEVGTEVDAIVGGTFMRYFVTTIDYPAGEIVLAEYSDPSHIDPREYVRPGFDLVRSNGRWVVSDVFPGTDAVAQGIQSGETVEQLGGVDIRSIEADEAVAAIYAEFDVGEVIAVGIDRAGGLETIDVLVEDLLPEFQGP